MRILKFVSTWLTFIVCLLFKLRPEIIHNAITNYVLRLRTRPITANPPIPLYSTPELRNLTPMFYGLHLFPN